MKQHYLTLLIIVGFFTNSQLIAQNCPPTGFTNGSSLFFFYQSGTSDCVDRPTTVTVGTSEFTIADCGDIFSVYNLSSGSPLTTFSPFTADFGFGTCEYTDGNLSNQTLSVNQVNSLLRLITLYPNPVTGGNTITFKDHTQLSVKVEIYSVTGKLILTTAINNAMSNHIDISKLNNGVYLVKIEANQTSVTKKLIVSK
jgi:hypothetical protein